MSPNYTYDNPKRCACGSAIGRRRSICTPCKCAKDHVAMAVRLAAKVPTAVRHAVLARDGMVCRHCGCAVRRSTGWRDTATDTMTFDHFPLAVSRGGTGTADNVVIACRGCNQSQGAR